MSHTHTIIKPALLQGLLCQLPLFLHGTYAILNHIIYLCVHTHTITHLHFCRASPAILFAWYICNIETYNTSMRANTYDYEPALFQSLLCQWLLFWHSTAHPLLCVRVTSHMWMSHVTHVDESCHTCGWIMPHMWMNHATRTNEEWPMYEWVVSHIWMRHCTRTIESCPCIWMSHVTRLILSCAIASCHTYEGVTYTNESCHVHTWVMSRTYMSHVTYIHESCHTYAWVMSHIHMSHLIQMERVTSTFYHVTHTFGLNKHIINVTPVKGG